jgi:hypothetical protein
LFFAVAAKNRHKLFGYNHRRSNRLKRGIAKYVRPITNIIVINKLKISHAYDMRERKVLNDNEWFGWVEWMCNCFRLGTIKEHWNRMQENHWYDATFENFINKQVIAYVEREIR